MWRETREQRLRECFCWKRSIDRVRHLRSKPWEVPRLVFSASRSSSKDSITKLIAHPLP